MLHARPLTPVLSGLLRRGLPLTSLLIGWLAGTAVAQPAGPSLPQINSTQRLEQLLQEAPLTVSVSQEFASRLVHSETVEEGPVRDFVLGAHVAGHQRTRARTSLDFIPHEGAARMLLVLEGEIHNRTANHTPHAIVHSEGDYRFHLAKQIEFDGHLFLTRSPGALMMIQQRNRGAETPVSPMPVIGPLASMVALHAADRRRPISERIAAARVTQQVAPRFNQEIDRQLGALNEALSEKIRPMLESWNALPGEVRAVTTADALMLAVRPRETSSSRPMPPILAPPGEGASLFLHESALNEMVVATPLAGLELPDSALQRLTRPNARPAEPATPELATIIFDRDAPLRFALKDGLVEIAIRASFRPVLGPEVPSQVITLTIQPVLEEEQVTVRMQLRDVQPVDPSDADAVSTVARNIIRQQLEQQLEEFELARAFEIPAATRVGVQLASVRLEQGWLVTTFQAAGSTGPRTSRDEK
jgi:hypothetical protein